MAEQLTLFDLNLIAPMPPAQTRVIEKAVDTKIDTTDICSLSPLSKIPPEAELKWRSYALSCYEMQGRFYTLLIPEPCDKLKDALAEKGLKPNVSWTVQAEVLKALPVSKYQPDEMVQYPLGMAGNIKGGYAIRPICPTCNAPADIIKGEDGMYTLSCGHKIAATEVILPSYKYAQHVFESLL